MVAAFSQLATPCFPSWDFTPRPAKRAALLSEAKRPSGHSAAVWCIVPLNSSFYIRLFMGNMIFQDWGGDLSGVKASACGGGWVLLVWSLAWNACHFYPYSQEALSCRNCSMFFQSFLLVGSLIDSCPPQKSILQMLMLGNKSLSFLLMAHL